MISFVVPTKNRPQHLQNCVSSILECHASPMEILVIDQSNDDATKRICLEYKSSIIRYYKNTKGGKAISLNLGIRYSKGTVIAFIDDDCIVSKTWGHNIYKNINSSDVAAITGNTLPYNPNKHRGYLCPCTMQTSSKIIEQPEYHSENIGFGNNMVIKKYVFTRIGLFKGWLGPGSVGDNAEDADIFIRILTAGYKIYHDSSVIVYHNKWLTADQMTRQQLSYACGEMACYGYYAIQGSQFAKPVVWGNVQDSVYKVRRIIKKLLFLNWNLSVITEGKFISIEILFRVRGLLVGWFYALICPVLKRA